MKHRIFILIGCLLWCCSFFGETLGYQPYSSYGLIISPLLLGLGLVLWLKYYKSTRGYYPKFLKVGKEISRRQREGDFFAGFNFMFSHILEFWTFSVLFWMGLVLFGYLLFTKSTPFAVTKAYCLNNPEIHSKTGRIIGFGVLVSGKITGRDADLSFTIIGEKGNFSANSEVSKENDEWTVKNLNIF